MTNTTTNTRTININAGAFIIPNPVGKINGFIFESDKNFQKELLNINGFSVDEEEKCVQLWVHNKEELGSDNLNDHGFTMEIDGEEYLFMYFDLNHIPVSMLENVQEGDSIQILIPFRREVRVRRDGEWEEIDMKVVFDTTIKFEQLPYRYGRFGRFEEVLKSLGC